MIRTLFVLGLCTANLAAAVSDGLRWHQGDEKTAWSLTGRGLGGASPVADGKVGGALRGDQLEIQATGLMDANQGTWSAWVRRAAGPLPTKGRWPLLGLSGGNFAVTTQLGGNAPTFFMVGGNVSNEVGFKWDYGVSSQIPACWPGGAWHHVAITWDRQVGKRLWLDGVVVASGSAVHLGAGIGPSQRLHFGGGEVATDFDEMMLWSRSLAPDELVRLARDPAAVAAEIAAFAAVQPKPETVAWPVDIPLLVVAKDGVPGVVVPGDTAVLPVTVRNPGAEPWSGTVHLSWVDWRDCEVARSQHEVAVAAGASAAIEARLTPAKRGVFKLSATISHRGRSLSRDVATLASWPLPAADQAPGFFGHHVGSWNEQSANWGKRFGINQVRGHNMLQATWWPRVEPEEGRFSWDNDHQVSYWQDGAVVGQLFGTPWWADAKGPRKPESQRAYPSGARPKLEPFVRYCETTVGHFKDRIKTWEIWNEPDVSMFWSGSPEELAELVSAGTQAVKRADPGALVMAAGFTPGFWAWHAAFAKAGGLTGLDAISFHAYHSASADHEQQWRGLSAAVGHFRAIARENLGRELPLWDTEGGCGDDSWLHGVGHKDLAPEDMRNPIASRRAAYAAVFHPAFLMELGVQKSFQYLWNGPGTGLQALELTGVPKQRALARQTLQELVNHRPHRGIVRRDEGRVRASLWEVPAGTLVLFFAGQEAEVLMQAEWPAAVIRRLDLMGNPLPADTPWLISEEPWYAEIAAPPAAVRKVLETARLSVVRDAVAVPEAVDPAKAGHNVPDLPPFPAAMELALQQRPISLAVAANMGFKDDKAGDGVGGSFDEGRFNCLHPVPCGRQTFHGVGFDILDPANNQGRSAVVLPGTTIPGLPRTSAPIAVGARVRCLWFLHDSNWSGKAGNRIATYRVRYADGQEGEIPVVVDQGIRDWWQGFDAKVAARPVPIRIETDADGRPAWRFLHVMEWVNPRSDVAITDIVLESAGKGAAVLVAGITAAIW